MPIRIFNSLTSQKEEFVPLDPPKVKFYNCGPTVYGEFHIGNARNFVVVDVIRRWLIARGYQVTYAQNITDVDDKIINRANAEGVETTVITERYTKYFFEKLKELGNMPADHHPRALQHIGGMVALIRKLVDRGHAYPTPDGSVWFEVGSFADYGKLSRMPLDQMQQGERVDEAMQGMKKSPLDFGLWKAAKPGEPSWPSPWGAGRPGWHIECSCMSMKALGTETLDIHAGGSDLRFPHHENEIAQSEAATGKPFSRFWIHNGMLSIDGSKMGKSLGNMKNIDDVLAVVEPIALRYFLISGKYRDQLDFTESALHKCVSAMERTVTANREAARVLGATKAGDWAADEELAKLWAEFADAMDDDFGTPRALAAMANTTSLLNRLLVDAQQGGAKDRLAAANALLLHMRGVLGLGPELEKADTALNPEATEKVRALAAELGAPTDGDGAALVAGLIALRASARKAKNFALGDQVRNQLTAMGIMLEDKPGETVWKKV